MRRFAYLLPLSLAAALCAACGSKPTPAPAAPTPVEPARSRVVSWDLLAREPVANNAEVRHILIGWRDLAAAYGGGIDERAAARSQAEAETLVETVLAKLGAGTDFVAAMAEYSEDAGSATSGRSYQAAPDAGLVLEFRQMSLRLAPGEIGVCQSQFGFHIIKRFE